MRTRTRISRVLLWDFTYRSFGPKSYFPVSSNAVAFCSHKRPPSRGVLYFLLWRSPSPCAHLITRTRCSKGIRIRTKIMETKHPAQKTDKKAAHACTALDVIHIDDATVRVDSALLHTCARCSTGVGNSRPRLRSLCTPRSSSRRRPISDGGGSATCVVWAALSPTPPLAPAAAPSRCAHRGDRA